MPTESGFSNQKAIGPSRYKTIHNVGSDKFAENVITKGLVERQAAAIAITAVTLSTDRKEITLTIPAHEAVRAGEVLRFYTGTLEFIELDIFNVVDANNLKVYNVMEALPIVGDTVKTAYYRTPEFDISGGVIVSPGPIEFVQDGVDTQVEEDTAVPANNKPLPAGLYFYKDGVAVPVNKDTVTPANTEPIPVEIVSAAGVEINITAGDINVHLSDVGANFDATRIGDGSGIYLAVNADGSINVVDADVLAELVTLNTVDFATEAKQDTQITELQDIEADVEAMSAKLPATLGQKAAAASLSVILASDQGAVPVSGPLTDAELRATAVPVSGPLTDAELRATAVPVSGPLTDAELRAAPVEVEGTIDVVTGALTPSYQEIVNLTNVAQDFIAPANAKWAKVQADDTNAANIRVKIGGVATTTSGLQFQPGRSEDYTAVGNISVICESADVNQKIYVQFGV